ncbi:MAG: hypothetical protein M3Q07_28460, partial [Pseudobdellovibrionaceae bacterium]|nr:hypothetical protein [Pseudobdellovibrionaceae bacterium]
MMNRTGFLLGTVLAGSALAQPIDWSWAIDWRPALIQADDSRSGAWLPPDHPDLQVSGRVSWTEQNKLRVIWPGTQIQGRFTGRSLAVQLEDSGRTDYQVIIDGDLKNSRLLDTVPGFHVYPLAQDLTAGEHRFEIFRRTETFSDTTQ